MYTVYVLPIHSEEPLHWTFLVLTTPGPGSCDVSKVEYYDWLLNIESNRNKAMLVLAALTDGQWPEDVFPRRATNTYRQGRGTNDCGLALWWVLEDKMRELRGEGCRTVYPNPANYRKQLATLMKILKKGAG